MLFDKIFTFFRIFCYLAQNATHFIYILKQYDSLYYYIKQKPHEINSITYEKMLMEMSSFYTREL